MEFQMSLRNFEIFKNRQKMALKQNPQVTVHTARFARVQKQNNDQHGKESNAESSIEKF